MLETLALAKRCIFVGSWLISRPTKTTSDTCNICLHASMKKKQTKNWNRQKNKCVLQELERVSFAL